MVFFKVSPARAAAPKSSDWTRSFRPQSAWRAGQLTLWTMTACALVLPISFSHKTEAETQAGAPDNPASQSPALSQLPAPNAEIAVQSPAPNAETPSSAPTDAPAKLDAPANLDAPAKSEAPAKLDAPAKLELTAIVAGKTQRGSFVPIPGMTVGQALAAMGIELSVLDRVSPAASTPFSPGVTMRVTRVQVELRTRREPIPSEVRYLPTTKLKAGTKQTTQFARAGYTEIVEKVWLKDGKESGRAFVSKKVGQAPQHQIVALGVNSRFVPANIAPHKRYARALTYRGGSPRDRAATQNAGAQNAGDGALFATGQLRVLKTLKMMTTGYNGAEFGGGGARTATGIRVGYGAIAVDPRVIPLGSQLYVEGYGYGFACDTGGAIKGNHIDLAFDSVRAANNHGKVRGVTVYILGK